ncbi:hypothetical protein ACTR42_004673 [Citrobacter freundii]
METIIPLVIVSLLLWQAVSYARVVFLRRHLMMPAVERFLRREDASKMQKTLAKEAFSDALSPSLPLDMLRAHRMQQRLKSNREMGEKEKEFMAECLEKSSANEALSEIIHIMFKLNLKFNTPLHFVCFLCRLETRQPVRAEIVKEEFGSAYADLKHHHQHV